MKLEETIYPVDHGPTVGEFSEYMLKLISQGEDGYYPAVYLIGKKFKLKEDIAVELYEFCQQQRLFSPWKAFWRRYWIGLKYNFIRPIDKESWKMVYDVFFSNRAQVLVVGILEAIVMVILIPFGIVSSFISPLTAFKYAFSGRQKRMKKLVKKVVADRTAKLNRKYSFTPRAKVDDETADIPATDKPGIL